MTFRPGAQFLLAKNVIMFGGYYVIGLQSAVESNFAVVGECLKNDYGVAQQELDDLLKEIHILNEKEGWY